VGVREPPLRALGDEPARGPLLEVAEPSARGALRRTADGRLAGPPLVVRATETGVRPTVGVRRAPESVPDRAPGAEVVVGRAPRAAVVVGRVPRAEDPVGPTAGARRFTDDTPLGRDVRAAAVAVRVELPTAAAPDRGCARRPVAT